VIALMTPLQETALVASHCGLTFVLFIEHTQNCGKKRYLVDKRFVATKLANQTHVSKFSTGARTQTYTHTLSLVVC